MIYVPRGLDELGVTMHIFLDESELIIPSFLGKSDSRCLDLLMLPGFLGKSGLGVTKIKCAMIEAKYTINEIECAITDEIYNSQNEIYNYLND